MFEATIQVLLAEGLKRLTTTRVAARAGVSVGTMYQYFPHKQALLYALNERYLDVLAEKVEHCCKQQNGAPIEKMIQALVDTYWTAKTERSDVTRALYRSVVELDNDALIEAFSQRVNAATLAMFNSATISASVDLALINTTLLSVIFGTVRNVFERNLPIALQAELRAQLVMMCLSYLETAIPAQARTYASTWS